MVKKILLLVAMMVATTTNAHEFRRAKTFEDAYLASCRVDVSNARGTGTFIGVDAENRRGVILTNYHVVTNNATATLNFWKNGEQKKISGKIFARFYDANLPADFALIAVDLDALASIDPPYVALGGADAAPDVNSYILSSVLHRVIRAIHIRTQTRVFVTHGIDTQPDAQIRRVISCAKVA